MNGWGSMVYKDSSAHWGKWKTWLEKEVLCDGIALYVQADGFR